MHITRLQLHYVYEVPCQNWMLSFSVATRVMPSRVQTSLTHSHHRRYVDWHPVEYVDFHAYCIWTARMAVGSDHCWFRMRTILSYTCFIPMGEKSGNQADQSNTIISRRAGWVVVVIWVRAILCWNRLTSIPFMSGSTISYLTILMEKFSIVIFGITTRAVPLWSKTHSYACLMLVSDWYVKDSYNMSTKICS